MKYLYIFLFAFIITGCNRTKYIEFTGNMQGINNGVFVIKDLAGTPVYSESIFDGKLQFKKILQGTGYYDMFITPDITKDYKKHVYDVYLEPGTYTINCDTGKLDRYPAIKSSSIIQNELTDYYTLATAKMYEAKDKINKINQRIYSKNGPPVHSDEYNDLTNQVAQLTVGEDMIQLEALEEFVNEHPQNYVEAHILSKIDYKKDSKGYFSIYQKFTPEQKNTPDGKSEFNDLKP